MGKMSLNTAIAGAVEYINNHREFDSIAVIRTGRGHLVCYYWGAQNSGITEESLSTSDLLYVLRKGEYRSAADFLRSREELPALRNR
jgi:hypothetical protein